MIEIGPVLLGDGPMGRMLSGVARPLRSETFRPPYYLRRDLHHAAVDLAHLDAGGRR